MTCHRFDGKVGYKGQKYEVRYTRASEEHVFGWQNDSTGGLIAAACMMPGVTTARIVRLIDDKDMVTMHVGHTQTTTFTHREAFDK